MTKKYLELRNLLVETVPESLSLNPLPPLPLSVPTADYGEIKMTLYISLLSTLQYVPVSSLHVHIHSSVYSAVLYSIRSIVIFALHMLCIHTSLTVHA